MSKHPCGSLVSEDCILPYSPTVGLQHLIVFLSHSIHTHGDSIFHLSADSQPVFMSHLSSTVLIVLQTSLPCNLFGWIRKSHETGNNPDFSCRKGGHNILRDFYIAGEARSHPRDLKETVFRWQFKDSLQGGHCLALVWCTLQKVFRGFVGRDGHREGPGRTILKLKEEV